MNPSWPIVPVAVAGTTAADSAALGGLQADTENMDRCTTRGG